MATLPSGAVPTRVFRPELQESSPGHPPLASGPQPLGAAGWARHVEAAEEMAARQLHPGGCQPAGPRPTCPGAGPQDSRSMYSALTTGG